MGTDKKVIHRSYMALGKSRILDFLHIENEVVRVCTRTNWIETRSPVVSHLCMYKYVTIFYGHS